MKSFNEVIAENYPTVKKYFPRLSSYLMTHIMNDQKTDKHTTSFIDKSENLMLVLCNFILYDNDLKNLYNYALSKLTSEDVLNKNYYDFIDGKLYDKDLSTDFLTSQIEDSVIYLEAILDSMKKKCPELANVSSHLNICAKHIIKHTDANSDLYLCEYLELSFLYIYTNLYENINNLTN